MTTEIEKKNAPWMAIAEKYLGVAEIDGARDNPVIIKFYASAGHPEIKDEDVAWCSAFANAVMYESGRKGTQNLMARSWLRWTEGDTVSVPRYGDIAVFKRGSDPVYGHVAFFERWDDDYVYVLGGNQSDAVTHTKISRDKLLGFRRPKARTSEPAMPKMTQVEPKKVKVEISDIVVATAPVAAVKDQSPYIVFLVFILCLGAAGYLIWKRKNG